MLEYLIRRLLLMLVTFFGVTIVLFTLVSMMPGDPAELMLDGIQNPEQSAELAEQIRERFHLDDPIHIRYLRWMADMVTGDLGVSFFDEKPVIAKVNDAVWPTVRVNISAVIIAFIISIPIGLYSAARQGGWFDQVAGVVLYMMYSLPSFVGAIILILYLSVRWGLLPFQNEVGDNYDSLGLFGKFADMTAHMTIYLICATYASLAFYSRFVRQNLLEVIRQDYIRTARAKGLPEHTVVVRHAFRNTLIPFITLIGLLVPALLGGSVILESLFNWPGLGRLMIDSIRQRDYPVIMAISTATAVLVLVANLVVDLLYGVVDPRVTHK